MLRVPQDVIVRHSKLLHRMAPKTDVQPIARSSLTPGKVRHSSVDKTDTIGELCGASSQHILHRKAV